MCLKRETRPHLTRENCQGNSCLRPETRPMVRETRTCTGKLAPALGNLVPGPGNLVPAPETSGKLLNRTGKLISESGKLIAESGKLAPESGKLGRDTGNSSLGPYLSLEQGNSCLGYRETHPRARKILTGPRLKQNGTRLNH